MSVLDTALYDVMAGDAQLVSMLALYKGLPGVFNSHPVPGDAGLPYIVSAGDVTHLPWDTKNSRGRSIIRDIRAYAGADGSVVIIDAIAERVRALFHRRALSIQGYNWVISDVNGPVALDGDGVYGRTVSLSVKAQEA